MIADLRMLQDGDLTGLKNYADIVSSDDRVAIFWHTDKAFKVILLITNIISRFCTLRIT
jgi:hypothetical protein